MIALMLLNVVVTILVVLNFSIYQLSLIPFILAIMNTVLS
jgi:hypothetical protein